MIKCRTCGSTDASALFVSRDLNQGISEEIFQHYRCKNCESIYIYPAPSNLSKYYKVNYPAYELVESETRKYNAIHLERAKLLILRQLVPCGKLLEIGPAMGNFLELARENDYQVSGIEQNLECVTYMREILGLSIEHSNKPEDELVKMKESCDVVVAWHVIEHLPNLREFVSAATMALRQPNGIILLSAPNPMSWSFGVFGRYWAHLDSPRHLNLIPLAALDAIMESNGMERVFSTYTDPVGLQLSKMGWHASLLNLVSRRNFSRKSIDRLGWILSLAAVHFDRIFGKGSAYTAAYRKRPSL